MSKIFHWEINDGTLGRVSTPRNIPRTINRDEI